jgi:RNA polymerase sigma factor (sigma-70 family)
VSENSLSPVLRFVRRLARGPDTVSADGQLLGRLIDGQDSAALAALMGRYGPLVLGVCRRVLGNAHDAEDAFQATFLVLVRKAATVRRRDALGPWLHGVALRIARKAQGSAIRRRARERRAATAEAADPRDDLDRSDLRGVLDEEVSRLPARYREPLVLCYFEGRTKEQAARQLGCPAGTVSTRLARGRERLRVRLTRRGLGPCLALAGSESLAHEAPAAVPPALLANTVRGVLQLAAGRAADPGLLSGQAVALAHGVTRSMNMDKRRVKGSKDWAKYEIVLEVPEEGKHITVGVLVSGKGQAWVDDFKLEVVDKKVKSTDLLEKPIENEKIGEGEVADKPVNLDFEDKDGK